VAIADLLPQPVLQIAARDTAEAGKPVASRAFGYIPPETLPGNGGVRVTNYNENKVAIKRSRFCVCLWPPLLVFFWCFAGGCIGDEAFSPEMGGATGSECYTVYLGEAEVVGAVTGCCGLTTCRADRQQFSEYPSIVGWRSKNTNCPRESRI
jgi:hypothetical protein